MSIVDDYDRRRERTDTDRENSARLAQAYVVYSTTGQGTIQFEDSFDFDLVFIEKPFVSHSFVCDADELAEELGVVDSSEVPYPVSSGFVTYWQQDENDFYTGCWLGAKVSFDVLDLIPVDAQPTLEHHFTFAGIAMKDIPLQSDDPIDA